VNITVSFSEWVTYAETSEPGNCFLYFSLDYKKPSFVRHIFIVTYHSYRLNAMNIGS
jgi:hypothetical protein